MCCTIRAERNGRVAACDERQLSLFDFARSYEPVVLPNPILPYGRMTSPPAEEYDLFLSHTGTDKDWVRTLGERLEREGIEDRDDSRLIKVFSMNGILTTAQTL